MTHLVEVVQQLPEALRVCREVTQKLAVARESPVADARGVMRTVLQPCAVRCGSGCMSEETGAVDRTAERTLRAQLSAVWAGERVLDLALELVVSARLCDAPRDIRQNDVYSESR